MKKLGIGLVGVLLIVLLIAGNGGEKETDGAGKIKAINLSTDYTISQALTDVEIVGANAVNVPIVIKIPSVTSNEMVIDESSKKKAISLIKKLKKKKVKVILEAYPWIRDGSEYETAYNPKNKQQFFRDWTQVLLTLTREVANRYDVYMMYVASNFVRIEPYEREWMNVIKQVKGAYEGLVSYKTSWWYTASWDQESTASYQKKLHNKLFSKVDVIAIAAYFELSHQDTNTVNELTKALRRTTIYQRHQNVVWEIEQFYQKYNKPIFFGELGFPRRNGAAKHPWDSQVTTIENNLEQSRGFQAYKNVFEKVPYLKGVSIFALGEKGKDKAFYPSKESIRVIKSWYQSW